MNKQDLYDTVYDVVMLDDEPGDKETYEYIINHYDIEKIYYDFNCDIVVFAEWIRSFMWVLVGSLRLLFLFGGKDMREARNYYMIINIIDDITKSERKAMEHEMELIKGIFNR